MRVLTGAVVLLAIGVLVWLMVREPAEEIHIEGNAVMFAVDDTFEEEMTITGIYSPEHLSLHLEALPAFLRGRGELRHVFFATDQVEIDVFWDGTSLTGGTGVRGEFHQQRIHAVVRDGEAVRPFTVIIDESFTEAVVQHHHPETGEPVETAVPAAGSEEGAQLLEDLTGSRPHEHE
ncbi:hypothetical protein [Alkalicoccus saliphilus]|uniref:Uncharacterized protein n=1 Tax=Alkalicoccus saliphilus TaxID=200989 RepID=A0A2T4U314_9BACI|nr:hypothetical protein [Alkalicoccus saliphilus]PTL37792.1 hypothetical protein C6Y45_14620 [Alkalicoccus saliphilus]